MFLENSIESEDIKAQVRGGENNDFSHNNDISDNLRNNQEFTDYAQQLMRIRRNNQNPRTFFSTIRLRSKNIFFHGGVMAFYIIAVITTFIMGIYGFSQMVGPNFSVSSSSPLQNSFSNATILNTSTNNSNITTTDNSTYHTNIDSSNNSNQTNTTDTSTSSSAKITFNIFTYTLPFVSFILDHSTKRLLGLPEKSIYLMLKLVAIIYYLGAYVLALQQPGVTSKYYIIGNINFLVFPPLTLLYGHLLRKMKLA